MHPGDDEENQNLIAALEAEAGEEEQHAFVIGAGDMEAPADLLGATGEPLPMGMEQPIADGAPAAESFGDLNGLGQFGSLEGGSGDGHVSAAEDPFAQPSPFANEALGADLAAATDLGLASEFGAGEEASGLGELADVDGMLAAALPEGELSLGELELPVPAGDAPTFQVQLEAPLDAALRKKLQELAAAQGIQLTPSAWEYGLPVISQLNEFQAVLFQKEARALGARARASVKFPVPQPSEEDLALGELAGIPEPSGTFSEGAPSVELPKRESEVLLFTGELLPGFSILETRGIITAHRCIVRRMFREEEVAAKMKREMERASGRSAAPADSHLQLLFRELFSELQKAALKNGANAVLALRVEFFPETAALDPASAELRLLVMGTAAVVEKA